MTKFIKWLTKDLNAIGIILIILVVPLYIIYFSEYINAKAVNILIAVAAIASTFFLYLSFRESRKSNQLKILESDFDRYEKQIIDIEAKGKITVFSDDNTILIADLNFKDFKLKNLIYSRFITLLEDLLSTILNYNVYNDTVELFGNNEIIDLPKDEPFRGNVKRLCAIQKIIMHGLVRLQNNAAIQCQLYDTIDISDMLHEQKLRLIKRLNESNSQYSDLGIAISNDRDIGKLLEHYIFFQLSDENKLRKSSLPLDKAFEVVFNLTESIKQKYK